MHKIPTTPAMEAECVSFLGTLLDAASCYLEYGSGGSTVFAAQKGVECIYSVESDLKWASDLESLIGAHKASEGQKVHIMGVDIGPTREWGMPIDNSGKDRYPNYPTQIWDTIIQHGNKPSVILIDGRFRVACFCHSVIHAQPGTIIILDDYQPRPHYHVVEELIQPFTKIGRMAAFKVPDQVDKEKAAALFEASKFLPG